jgi:hypothetical protein
VGAEPGCERADRYFLRQRGVLDIFRQYQFISRIWWGFLGGSQVMGLSNPVTWYSRIGLALLLAWRKPGDILSLLISALFIAGGVQIASVTYVESRVQDLVGFAWLDPLQNYLGVLSFYGLAVFIFIFPDGQFVPRFLGRWVGGYLFQSGRLLHTGLWG